MRWPCCGSFQQSTSSSLSSSLSSLNNEGSGKHHDDATTTTKTTQGNIQNHKELANGGKRRKGTRLQLRTLNFTKATSSTATTSANAERRQPEGILKGTHHRIGRPPGRAVQYADGTNSGDDEDALLAVAAGASSAEQRPMLTHQQDSSPTCSSPSPTSSALSSPPHASSPMDKYGPMLLRPCKRALLVLTSTSSTPSPPNCPFINNLRHAGWEVQTCSCQSALENVRQHRPVIVLLDGTVGASSKERALLADSLSSMRTENGANHHYQSGKENERQQQQQQSWHVGGSTEIGAGDAEDMLFSWLLHKTPSDKRRRQMTKLGVQQFFLSSSPDISLCEHFCRLSSRLRAVPALFAVVEEAQQPIKICDDHNIVQYVNKAYELLTGRSRTAVLGSDAVAETAHRTHYQHSHYYQQQQHQQNNRSSITSTATPNNVATAAVTASATAAVTAAISWSTVGAGTAKEAASAPRDGDMTGTAANIINTGNSTPCSPPPQFKPHPPLITTSPPPPPMAKAEGEEQQALMAEREYRAARGETVPPTMPSDSETTTTPMRKRSNSGGDQPRLTIDLQQKQQQQELGSIESNEKPDRPAPPSPTASRRRSSDWQCIAVPTSSNSHQYVYVKRGSADAAFFRTDRSEKGRSPGWVDAPITEALSALGNILHRCDEETQAQLREAMRILSSSELYTPTITRFRENDRIASGYYDGLIRLHHPNRQRKRSVVDAFRDHQHRRASAGSTISGLVGHAEGIEQQQQGGLQHPHHLHSKDVAAGRIASHVIAAHRRVSTEIINMLEREEFWDFNVIELERVTDHHPLSSLGLKIFERWNVAEVLHCPDDVLHKWFAIIEANYQAGNAYHNATHAADVLQATSYFLNSDPVGQLIQDQHAPAALIAATVHDLDHPGRGNAFLMNTRQRLALLYNDQSILENHHVALAFQLTLAQPGVNIFAQMAREEFTQMRQAIIDMVLATDMSKHFEHLAKFQQLMAILPDADDNRDANSLIICRMMIKCADIGNPTREWKLCYKWALRIVHEYFDQTAEEIERKLPVTMKGFDRETCNVPMTQCTFVDMFARETFTLWCEFADLPHLMTHLEENFAQWKARSADWDPTKNVNLLQQTRLAD